MTLKEHTRSLLDVKKSENHYLASYAKKLKTESTVELIRRIVENSDRTALKVLLETRKLFRIKNGPPLLLNEFLLILRERITPPDGYEKEAFADCVYDLTMAKYSNFPDPNSDNLKSGDYA